MTPDCAQHANANRVAHSLAALLEANRRFDGLRVVDGTERLVDLRDPQQPREA